jgi:hypothetical protein
MKELLSRSLMFNEDLKYEIFSFVERFKSNIRKSIRENKYCDMTLESRNGEFRMDIHCYATVW